jgi:hypothetical protein
MATLSEQLEEARAAYHDLITGKAARVVIDQNGERVEFVAANRQALYTYIQRLEAQIAGSSSPPSNAPARFIF